MPTVEMERKKAVQFQTKESRMLMELYVKNHKRYHAASKAEAYSSADVDDPSRGDSSANVKDPSRGGIEHDEREQRELLIRAAAPRHFRTRVSPLDVLDESAFRQRFRLSRRGFFGLIGEELSPETVRSRSLTSEQKLGIFLETIGSSSLQV
ncbi:unnamed protein product [Heligmosomoides polygyrus]|uniref:Uncharacterized protein n=1 Tax=Heligmosomoides polygyrus TaxID=6339 RepID=A0A183FQS7_HELPZ|nr:unnamed protein product [Heligmosomoides polygyrus]